MATKYLTIFLLISTFSIFIVESTAIEQEKSLLPSEKELNLEHSNNDIVRNELPNFAEESEMNTNSENNVQLDVSHGDTLIRLRRQYGRDYPGYRGYQPSYQSGFRRNYYQGYNRGYPGYRGYQPGGYQGNNRGYNRGYGRGRYYYSGSESKSCTYSGQANCYGNQI